jgi:hypothetical protein
VKSTHFFLKVFLIIYFLANQNLIGQELAGFELIDNNSVGLTVTPYTKWGASVADIDRNGYPDIFIQRYAPGGAGAYSRIFINTAGVFQDITDQSPLESLDANVSRTRTGSWADFDNDGDKDLLVCNDEAIHLLRNENNTFTDIAQEVGIEGGIPPGFITHWEYNTGAWADYDLDGDLDLLVEQIYNENFYLFQNENNIFTDIAAQVGLASVLPFDASFTGGWTLPSRMQWVDFDLDGDPDISAGPYLFENTNGQFQEVSESLNFLPTRLQLQNIEWLDYDNDGDLDYFKTSTYENDPGTSELWANENGSFVNVTESVFSLDMRIHCRGISAGDFDNDGDLDLFLSINIQTTLDQLMLNEEIEPGVHVFEDVADLVGITKMGDRKGGAFFDYDRDGFLDLYVPSAEVNHILYHNLKNSHNWVGFILEGTVSNRDAVGTLVTLYAGGKSQIRYTKSTNGFLRQDNPWVHFGLGLVTAIDSVVIKWPLGSTEVLKDVSINQYHEIKEGESTSRVNLIKDTVPAIFSLKQNYPNPFNPQTYIRYSMGKASEAQIIISNVLGQEVQKYTSFHKNAGTYEIVWDGTDENGVNLPSGLYFYRLEIPLYHDLKKMLLIR